MPRCFSNDQWNVIKNGIPVAIVGHTNVGKSTLLNALLNEERAIVSDIHGTTRDAIEDTVNLGGITFRFIDTAGIRKTTDHIESIGIELTYSKIQLASIVLLLVDINDTDEKIQEAVNDVVDKIEIDRQRLILVVNKTDLGDREELDKRFTAAKFPQLKDDITILPLSARFKTNLENLVEELLKAVNMTALDNDEVIVTNARHFEALTNALEGIERVIEGLENNISGDFLAQDIREVLYYIGSITGQISNDEILGTIFKNFCIGK